MSKLDEARSRFARGATAQPPAKLDVETEVKVKRLEARRQHTKTPVKQLRVFRDVRCSCSHVGSDHCADGSCGVCGCSEYKPLSGPR